MATKDHAINFAVGMAGGALMAFGAWFVVSKVIDRQFAQGSTEIVQRASVELQRTLSTEIPARVRETIDQKFRETGITRDTGRQISMLLSSLEGSGILGSQPR